ncbi:phosphotransferase [Paenibacillus dendritiformis]|uniref:phosphotransferase n=1 Tax=Paenibacillus dendritiformis TaxID=130049 RepID=UPI0034D9853C
MPGRLSYGCWRTRWSAVFATGYIHGDLGAWNLLRRKGRIYIIDFGEARLGDRHFDAAAALVSTASDNASVEETVTRLENFRRGYEGNAQTE